MTRGGRHATRGDAGLTLIELLVALAVSAIIALTLVALARSTSGSEAAFDAATVPRQTLDLAGALLTEELALAAAVPWPAADEVEGLPDGLAPRAYVTPGLRLSVVAGGHRVAMRYVDDRLAAGPLARSVAFEVGSDASGTSQLYRGSEGASRQPLVEGIDTVRVVAVAQAGALVAPSEAAADVPVGALLVRLTAGSVISDVVVALPARPLLAWSP